jgi:P27 family predicted phage terminase small subunit
MGARGPKPKPKSPGRPAHRQVAYESGAPNCPAWLPTGAKREWKRVARLMNAAGVLQKTDLAALTSYAIAFDEWRLLAKQVAEEGIMVRSGKKMVLNPLIAQRDKRQTQLTRAVSVLGFSPSARKKITVEPEDESNVPEPADPFDAFLKG